MDLTDMLSLFHSPASPYVRKVMVAAIECGVADQIQLLGSSASPVRRDQTIVAHNPTGKVPTLVLPDGRALFDSRVICQYLDDTSGGKKLYPKGAQKFTILTLEALADGLMDAALLLRYEATLRPEPLRWPDWSRGQFEKIDSSLEALDAVYCDTLQAEFHAGAIAVAYVLGYLDLRFAEWNWRAAAPKLRSWFENITERPSLRCTPPLTT